jgi:SAM-dependent methyltransferase
MTTMLECCSGVAGAAYHRARSFARHHPCVYALVRILKYGPFMGIRNQGRRKALLRTGIEHGWRMLYLGSGGRRQASMINIDITKITGPDVVGDGFCLPFRNGTFDIIFCDYVIEHVADPERFLACARSSLKPAGIFYLEVPFLQPLHDKPFDFTRWTLPGFTAAAERAGLKIVESGTHYGPAFTVFWIVKEWAALLLSLGVAPVRCILRYLFSWILAPIMLLDLMMLYLPHAEELASGFFVIALPASSTRTAETRDLEIDNSSYVRYGKGFTRAPNTNSLHADRHLP